MADDKAKTLGLLFLFAEYIKKNYVLGNDYGGTKTKEGKTIPLDVIVGDIVAFSKYSGSDIKIEAEDFLIMREDDILAIIG